MMLDLSYLCLYQSSFKLDFDKSYKLYPTCYKIKKLNKIEPH